MVNQNAYIYGFNKTAEQAGINPDLLIKYASDNNWVTNIYQSLSPAAKKSILGGLLTGAGTYAFSDGDVSNRLLKSLLVGGLSGAGLYGLQRSGLYDAGKKWVTTQVNKL